jgi:hypothetical protein
MLLNMGLDQEDGKKLPLLCYTIADAMLAVRDLTNEEMNEDKVMDANHYCDADMYAGNGRCKAMSKFSDDGKCLTNCHGKMCVHFHEKAEVEHK